MWSRAAVFVCSVLVTIVPASRSASAEPARVVAVAPATGTNVDAQLLVAARDFLVLHLQSSGRVEVRDGGGTEMFELHVSQFGRVTRVAVSVRDLATGKVVHSDQLPVISEDDLDKALQRIVSGYLEGRSGVATATTGTVTRADAAPVVKRPAPLYLGMRAMGAMLAGEGRFLPGLGAYAMFDTRYFLGEVYIDALGSETDGEGHFGVGAYYPLSDRDFTPYLGGGVRLDVRTSGVETEEDVGMSAVATTGILLGRLSTVQLRAEGSYYANLYETRADGGKDVVNHGLMFGIGLSFAPRGGL